MRSERNRSVKDHKNSSRPSRRDTRSRWNGGDQTETPRAGLLKMLSNIGKVPASITIK